jgi:hypothetical protein
MVKAIVQIMFYNVLFYEKDDKEQVVKHKSSKDNKGNMKGKDKQDTARNQ